jgi:hypothetical protein
VTATTPHYFRITPGEPLPLVSSLSPFKAVVVIAADYTPEWQDQVSDWLVENGCRYMMAWGSDCSSWHDSVDYADLKARDFEDNDSKFVMTTWHTDDSLEQVFWYSQFCANLSYDDVALTNAVILHVSNTDCEAELLNLFEQSKTLAEREAGEEN